MARGLAAIDDVDLTVIVNVGDDEVVHGLHVSADLDTVIYTLAGVEGSEGWGRSGDTFRFNEELGRFGVDNRFRVGDLDLAVNLYRTNRLREGALLSTVAAEISAGFSLRPTVLPVTDDPLRTRLRTSDGWLAFQDYFVLRESRDEVLEIRFDGAEAALPSAGVIEAIKLADQVVIAPSNPPLSVWPILAVPGVREAISSHPRVVAVSPLIGGKPLKGPADRVMTSLGLTADSAGVVDAYRGLIDTLVVDHADAGGPPVEVDLVITNTFIKDLASSRRLAEEIINL